MNPSTTTTVLYAEQGAVAILTLNRPDALNSFTRQMHKELWAALDQAEANPAIRALVITGVAVRFARVRIWRSLILRLARAWRI